MAQVELPVIMDEYLLAVLVVHTVAEAVGVDISVERIAVVVKVVVEQFVLWHLVVHACSQVLM